MAKTTTQKAPKWFWGKKTWPLYLMGVFFLLYPLVVVFDWKILIAVCFTKPEQWKMTQGVIVSSEVNKKWRAKFGTTISPRIRYTYSVNGDTYQGRIIGFSGQASTPEDPYKAEWVVNKYPVGKKVPVYYLPSFPDLCALEPRDKDYSFLVAAVLSFVVAIGFFIFTIKKDLELLKKCRE